MWQQLGKALGLATVLKWSVAAMGLIAEGPVIHTGLCWLLMPQRPLPGPASWVFPHWICFPAAQD